MARIRTIKPEFPHSETIGALSRDARLLFIQLWTIVDDDGRARAASRMLASLLYPYDTDAGKLIDKWLEELEANQCIRRYVVDGASYLDIPNWLKHQRIDKPTKSRLPEFANSREASSKPREASETDLGPVPRTLEGTLDPVRSVAIATRPRPSESDFEKFWKEYPKRGTASNPKKPAKDKFDRAVRAGADPVAIIAAARRYREIEEAAGRTGTEKVAQAMTWLNQQRWNDYPESAEISTTGPPVPPDPSMPSDAELRERYAGPKPDQKPENAGVLREGAGAYPADEEMLRHTAGTA